jgi:hypothetical protein
LYRTADDAAVSIVRVLRDPELQTRLRAVLKSNAQLFSRTPAGKIEFHGAFAEN